MILNSVSILAVLCLYVAWAFVYRSQQVDQTRSQLFALRHDLFMLAANGQIAFDADAYRASERLLNALIRYTHRMQLLRILAVQVLGIVPTGDAEQIYQAIQDHPDAKVRDKIRDITTHAGLLVIKHIAYSTLLTWALLAVARRIHSGQTLLKRIYNGSRHRSEEWARRIEDDALSMS